MRKQTAKKLVIFLFGLVFLGLFWDLAKPVYAVGPNLINFQGKVVNTDGTNVANGTYNFDFILWDDPTAGTNRWQELTKPVAVTNGVFQTNLGSVTALPDFNTYPNLYLAIRFNADAAGYMSPRVQLTSVPYALNADNLGGLSSSSFVRLAQGLQADSSTTNPSISISKTLASDVTLNGLDFTLTDNAAASTGTLYGLSITNADNGANVGVPDAIAYLKNANAADTVPNGLLIEQTGAGTLTSGLEVKQTAGAITNGLTLTGNFTKLINSTNFNVTNAGALSAVGVNSGTGLIQGTGGLTITGAAVSINTSSNFDTNINTGTSTGTVTIGNSSSTALKLSKFTTTNGVLYISATDGTTTETAASTGAQCLQTSGAGTAPIWGACATGGSGVTTIGAIDSQVKSADGGVISGTSLYFQTADASFPGLISTGTQTIAGAKTLTGAALFKNVLDSSTAFQIQNAAGYSSLTFDTTNKHLKIYENIATPANYLELYYDNATTSAIIQASSGTTKIGNGTGPITLNAGAGAAVNITGHAASTWSLDAGSLTIQGGTTLTLNSIGSNAVTLDSTTTGAVNVGTGASAKTVTIGSTTSTSATVIQGGSGNVNLSSTGGNITIGASDTTGTLLVLDTKTASGDPTGVNGGLYYNSNTNKFRCFQGAVWTDCTGAGGSTDLQTAYNTSTSPATITTSAADATKGIKIAAGTVPTADLLNISNVGFGVTSAGVNGLSVNYVGGAAAVESSGIRIDFTPGGTTGGTWSGLRIVAGATGAATGVTEYGLKLEGPTSPGAGTETGLFVGTGWDIGLDIQSGGLQLAAQTDPAVPATGNLRIYAKTIAGRVLPKWLGPSGVDTSFQANFGFNRIAMVTPSGTGTTVPQLWGTTQTNVGTVGNPALASTNLLTSTRRFTLTSATTAGSLSSHRQGALMAWRGNAAGLGGFFFTIRFATSTLQSGNRAFVGLADSVAAPTNVDPTTNTTPGKIGMAINASTGNWNWVNNITGTAPTVTALSASFPVNTTSLYELVIFSPPNGSSITYRITNLSTGAQTSDTAVSTNIPASTTFLSPLFWMTNNATAAAVVIDSAGWYLESDN